MKPDWKDAPEWARWLTMDADGTWCWFEFEPISSRGVWAALGGYHKEAGISEPLLTKFERPQTTDPDARPGSEGQGA